MKNNKYFLIVFIIILMLLIIPVFFMDRTSTKSIDALISINEEYDNLEETEKVELLKNVHQNDDIVGTLSINNSSYSTVIVQAKDNNYYLRKDINGAYARGGTPFLDYRTNLDTSKKALIYGHNSKYIEMPFKVLENYMDEDYFNNHRYITINTSEKEYKYEIFSVYVETDNWGYTSTNYKSNNIWLNHINNLKNKSIYETDTTLSKEDQILILQTCSTNSKYSKYKKKYLLIISRRVG